MKKMKKLSLVFLSGVLALGLAACGGNDAEEPAQEAEAPETTEASDDTLRLSTTTSVRDSGLLDAILPDFEEKTGYTVDVIAQGSGAALETGRRGDADALLVHSPKAEEEFMDEGYGENRQTFMHNFYVIVGPEADPAGIEGMDASAAFEAIANTEGAKFASRGDESGTHSKEVSIWEEVGIDPEAEMEAGETYLSLGKGMGDTLTFAAQEGTYTLTDLSTYLSMQDNLDGLVVLVDESDNLRNDYSSIEVSPEMNDNVNSEAAKAFSEWLVSEETLAMIAEYGVEEYGQPLFFVDGMEATPEEGAAEGTAGEGMDANPNEDPASVPNTDAGTEPARQEPLLEGEDANAEEDQVAEAPAEEADGEQAAA